MWQNWYNLRTSQYNIDSFFSSSFGNFSFGKGWKEMRMDHALYKNWCQNGLMIWVSSKSTLYLVIGMLESVYLIRSHLMREYRLYVCCLFLFSFQVFSWYKFAWDTDLTDKLVDHNLVSYVILYFPLADIFLSSNYN